MSDKQVRFFDGARNLSEAALYLEKHPGYFYDSFDVLAGVLANETGAPINLILHHLKEFQSLLDQKAIAALLKIEKLLDAAEAVHPRDDSGIGPAGKKYDPSTGLWLND